MPKAFFNNIDETPLKNNTGGFLGEKIRDLVNLKHKGGGDNKKENITLDDVFKYYQREEELEEKCNLNSEKITCYKSIKLENPENIIAPDDLIFSLKRYDNQRKKLNTFIDISNDLNLYNTTYYISAVIIHKGSYDGGHYYIYVKSEKKDMWIKLNDTEKKLVNNDSVIKKDINTNGYIFLYKNKNYNFNEKKRNGIQNIINSCYFNSILQLLISTDEYLNPDKMKQRRKSLYDFLTECTVKNNDRDINDGTSLRNFSGEIDGKKYTGVSVFGKGKNRLGQGCEEDAYQALGYILKSKLFPYNNNSIYKVENGNILEKKLSNKNNLDKIEFTLFPPFYEYICYEKLRYENKENENNKYMIQSLILEIPLPPPTTTITTTTTTNNENDRKKKQKKKKVIKKFEKINFNENNEINKESLRIFNHINKHLENIGSVELENPILKELKKNQKNLNESTKKLIDATEVLFQNIEKFKNDTSDYNEKIYEKEKIIEEKIKKISNLANDVFSS
jgi:hypothetical protein